MKTETVKAMVTNPVKLRVERICDRLGISEAEFVRAAVTAELKRKSREINDAAN